jgi:mono/diheme cytochrome c family protein
MTTIKAISTTLGRTAGLGLLALLAAGPLAGCRGERTDANPRRFFPDMDKQQRWDPQESTPFYADGVTGRQTPEHAVAFASSDFDIAAHSEAEWAEGYMAERAAMLKESDEVYTGKVIEADGFESYLDTIPVTVSRDMIVEGQKTYNIYCVACHGYAGDGKGMVGVRWSYPPANLTGEVYRDRTNRQGKDGYLFEVIREGVWGPDGANKMPGYGHAINEMEAWSVVAYLRTLQKARGSSWDDLTPEQQAALGQPTPAPQTAPAGGATEGGDS